MSLERLVRVVERFLEDGGARVKLAGRGNVVGLVKNGRYVGGVKVGDAAPAVVDELRACRVLGVDVEEAVARVLLVILATSLPVERAERVLAELARLAGL